MWIGTASIAAKGGSIRRATGREARPDAVWRAMEQLGVELILANSPQAKGRVERMNGVLQDRLSGNASGWDQRSAAPTDFWTGIFAGISPQFGRVAAAQWTCIGLWRDAQRSIELEEERVVQGDWTVTCGGKRYQLIGNTRR